MMESEWRCAVEIERRSMPFSGLTRLASRITLSRCTVLRSVVRVRQNCCR